MTKEEVIEHLDNCSKCETVDGPYAHFVVSISREDLVNYGTDKQVEKFDSSSVEDQRKMLNELIDEMHEMFEYDDFSEYMRTVCWKGEENEK